ncbi:IS701 family transposase [Streptomyces goshikiensis]
MFGSLRRKDQRANGDGYLRGLMLDGRRKSIQATAGRAAGRHEQNLQQFVNQPTWDPVPVQRRICERMLPLIAPTAWVIDDVLLPKDGGMSVGVAPQYCGDLGKRANCQVAVSVHAATDTASCPLQWRLFLPRSWETDADRRMPTRVPSEVTHREKWWLTLDMLDTLAEWGMKPPVVVADAAYGTNAHLRAGLDDRGIHHVLAVRADVSARPLDAEPEAPARNGPVGCWPQPRYPAPRTVSGDPGRRPRAEGIHQRHLAAGHTWPAAVPLRRRARPPRGQGRRADQSRCLVRAGLVGRGPA